MAHATDQALAPVRPEAATNQGVKKPMNAATQTRLADTLDDGLAERLNERLADLQARLQRLDAHLHREAGPLPADFAEQATALENEETVEGLRGETVRELGATRRALRRLETGVYEQCGVCGGAIGVQRLRALPTTTVCSRCAHGALAR